MARVPFRFAVGAALPLVAGLAFAPAAAQPAPGGAARPPAAGAATMTPPKVEGRRLLDRFASEPTVNQVQQAALSYYALHPEELGKLRSRAGWSHLLPAVRVEVTKELDDESRSLVRFDDLEEADDISAQEKREDDLELMARADWELNELVYSPDELSVLRENRLSAKERQKLLNLVTRVYFERRRAQIDLMTSPPSDPKARALAELKIAELTAELDALTGGAFSRMVAGG